jgi:hypothetical protein
MPQMSRTLKTTVFQSQAAVIMGMKRIISLHTTFAKVYSGVLAVLQRGLRYIQIKSCFVK